MCIVWRALAQNAFCNEQSPPRRIRVRAHALNPSAKSQQQPAADGSQCVPGYDVLCFYFNCGATATRALSDVLCEYMYMYMLIHIFRCMHVWQRECFAVCGGNLYVDGISPKTRTKLNESSQRKLAHTHTLTYPKTHTHTNAQNTEYTSIICYTCRFRFKKV